MKLGAQFYSLRDKTQTPEGIKIPEVLVPYTRFDMIKQAEPLQNFGAKVGAIEIKRYICERKQLFTTINNNNYGLQNQ